MRNPERRQPVLTLANGSNCVNSGHSDTAGNGHSRLEECITAPGFGWRPSDVRPWTAMIGVSYQEAIVIRSYVYSSCTSCRKTDAMLKESGVAYESRDFFKRRFSREELASLLDEAGLSVTGVLSTRSKVYKERQEEIDGLSEDALVDLMIEEPTLLRRPIVVGAGSVLIGHNPARLETLISAANA